MRTSMARIVIIFLILGACIVQEKVVAQTSHNLTKLTILRYHNQNPGMKYSTDTLLKDTLIDLRKTKADLYFAAIVLKYPYYMPTRNVYRNSAQANECGKKSKTKVKKCYQYDSLNRVIRMDIDDPQTGSHFWYEYAYDNANRVSVIKYLMDTCTVSYNSDGTLNEIYDETPIPKNHYYFRYSFQMK